MADEDQGQQHLGQQHAAEHRGEADRLEPQVVRPEPGQAAQRGDQDDEHHDRADHDRCGSAARRAASGGACRRGYALRTASLIGQVSGCGWQGRGKSRPSRRSHPVTGTSRQRQPGWAGGYGWPVGNGSPLGRLPARASSSQSGQGPSVSSTTQRNGPPVRHLVPGAPGEGGRQHVAGDALDPLALPLPVGRRRPPRPAPAARRRPRP